MSNSIRFEFYNNFDIWYDLYQENGGDPNHFINMMVYVSKVKTGFGRNVYKVEFGNGNEYDDDVYDIEVGSGNGIRYGKGDTNGEGNSFGHGNYRKGFIFDFANGSL